MAISANYPTPVYVNGFACNNCAQVAEAKKDINPADPQAGPGGIDAKSSSSSTQSPAFILGGALADAQAGAPANTAASPSTQASSTAPYPAASALSGIGPTLNISV